MCRKASSNNESPREKKLGRSGLFCVPICARDTKEALSKISKAALLADVLEIRLDFMDSFDIPVIVEASDKPLLFTYRSLCEGGRGDDKPEVARRHLSNAARAGAAFVDVELRLPADMREEIMGIEGPSRYVISRHFSRGTPDANTLRETVEEALDAGGHGVKIVTTALSWDDNFRVLGLLRSGPSLCLPLTAFCMGPKGTISRIIAHLMGSFFTFASLGEGEESALGQIPISRMKEILRLLDHAG
jgi:3-dehydroquinate dehydratase type I